MKSHIVLLISLMPLTAFCQDSTRFSPYKKVFFQTGVGLSGIFLSSQSKDQPSALIFPGLIPFAVEYGISKGWSMGLSFDRLGYGFFEDSVTSNTRAFNFVIRSFFSRHWDRKGFNYLKTDQQMRRWFVGFGISYLSWRSQNEVSYSGRTPCFQLGYDIKKRLGKHFFYGLCYGVSVSYFYSFDDINGKMATTLSDPTQRFDLLEFGPFCSFSIGPMIAGKKPKGRWVHR
jgi:hypothetical protein